MIAEQNGLELNVERQYYSPTVAEGKILSQLPPAGSQVRQGWQVRVAESLGPQRIAIPNVIGQTERAANINIRRRGLDVGAIAQMQSPDAPDSQVMAQAPPPNASGVSAPKISLLLATSSQPHAFVMPSFVGQQLGSTHPGRAEFRNESGKRDRGPASPKLPGNASVAPIPGQHDRDAKSSGWRESAHGSDRKLRSTLAVFVAPASRRLFRGHPRLRSGQALPAVWRK